ncbi:PREDICTED: uncharacterized protein LOC109167429 [Ipomoea nil]|uniref:uncharacterized protein LOC109167429 n=1 Tax=Ipomoea nil TaxID=35883 RepID=UPI0009016A45|nr:PREDICTED: uncharacterized protein LOC109167429 [Ipomoea nil]
MEGEFEMSMVGELNYFIGLQIRQQDNGIFISQSKYAKNLVKRFGLEEIKVVRTPVLTTERISKDLEGKKVEQTLYRSMIGGLLYLTASRPDLSFGVGICARYQANPTEQHLKAVKRIIKYVKRTTDLGIWYSFNTNPHLEAYYDADWARNIDHRKSTSVGCTLNLSAYLFEDPLYCLPTVDNPGNHVNHDPNLDALHRDRTPILPSPNSFERDLHQFSEGEEETEAPKG